MTYKNIEYHKKVMADAKRACRNALPTDDHAARELVEECYNVMDCFDELHSEYVDRERELDEVAEALDEVVSFVPLSLMFENKPSIFAEWGRENDIAVELINLPSGLLVIFEDEESLCLAKIKFAALRS